tara:strand:- start:172 stop:1032 length:861 start_codon:yes stop_codon:yes gene_type:complete
MLLEKLQSRKNKGKLIAEIKRSIREGKDLTETTKQILASPSFRLYADTVIKRKTDPITEDYFTDKEYNVIKEEVKSMFQHSPKTLKWYKSMMKPDHPDHTKNIPLPPALANTKNISRDVNTINTLFDWLERDAGNMYTVLGKSTLKIPHKESYDSAKIEIYDEYDFDSRHGGKASFLEQGKNILKDVFSGNFRDIYPAAMQLAEKYGAHVLPDKATAKREGVEAKHVPVSIKVPVSEIMDEDTWKNYQSSITYKEPKFNNKGMILPKLQFRKGGLNRKQYTNGTRK